MAALEELCEATHDLPAAGLEREEHVNQLQRVRSRMALANNWQAAAEQLLGLDNSVVTLKQLQVLHAFARLLADRMLAFCNDMTQSSYCCTHAIMDLPSSVPPVIVYMIHR